MSALGHLRSKSGMAAYGPKICTFSRIAAAVTFWL